MQLQEASHCAHRETPRGAVVRLVSRSQSSFALLRLASVLLVAMPALFSLPSRVPSAASSSSELLSSLDSSACVPPLTVPPVRAAVEGKMDWEDLTSSGLIWLTPRLSPLFLATSGPGRFFA